ncbi:MAG: chemotaxis protein CheX [Bacillota bacterium]
MSVATMRAEFINPFVSAAYKVLAKEARATVEKGCLSVRASSFTSQEVTVLIGVVGQVQGIVMYGMSERTVKSLVSAMTGEPTPVFDKLAESAIAEMGNVITGIASMELENAGYASRIAPPSVVVGRGVIISTIDLERLVIPLHTQYGDIEINVALRENLNR